MSCYDFETFYKLVDTDYQLIEELLCEEIEARGFPLSDNDILAIDSYRDFLVKSCSRTITKTRPKCRPGFEKIALIQNKASKKLKAGDFVAYKKISSDIQVELTEISIQHMTRMTGSSNRKCFMQWSATLVKPCKKAFGKYATSDISTEQLTSEINANYNCENPRIPDFRTDLITNEMVDDLKNKVCLLYTSPSPRDQRGSRMPSSA